MRTTNILVTKKNYNTFKIIRSNNSARIIWNIVNVELNRNGDHGNGKPPLHICVDNLNKLFVSTATKVLDAMDYLDLTDISGWENSLFFNPTSPMEI